MVALNQTRNPTTSAADTALKPRKTPPDNNSFPANRIRSLLRARYYNPHTAEFISTDPLEYVDGMSLFKGYFVGVGVDSNGREVYAIDGTWADESEDAHPKIKTGYSNVYQFYSETSEEKHYWGGPGTGNWAIGQFWNGALGRDMYSIIRKVKAQICSDFCEKKDNCEELEINLVGWSRGAVAAVEVADWLDYYGCLCTGESHRLFTKIPVNFLGLFDPVEMVFSVLGTTFENKIPSNVKFSYALWRTSGVLEPLYPQKKYTNLTQEEEYKLGIMTSYHGEVGREKPAYENHMKPVAIANGVDF